MNLAHAAGLGPAQTNKTRTVIVLGTIGNPVPTSLSDQVTVLPQDSTANGIGPMNWIPSQGATLPAYGDKAVVVFDQNYTPLCIWFDGTPTTQLTPETAPSAPASGFLLYVDEADGKLKAKASSGTVTTLATP